MQVAIPLQIKQQLKSSDPPTMMAMICQGLIFFCGLATQSLREGLTATVPLANSVSRLFLYESSICQHLRQQLSDAGGFKISV